MRNHFILILAFILLGCGEQEISIEVFIGEIEYPKETPLKKRDALDEAIKKWIMDQDNFDHNKYEIPTSMYFERFGFYAIAFFAKGQEGSVADMVLRIDENSYNIEVDRAQ